MKIQLLTKTAKLPTRATDGSAGFDVYVDQIQREKDHEVLFLGFASSIPEGFAALLMPRSGLGSRYGWGLRNTIGLIDSDYRGEWMIKADYAPGLNIKEGDRIAQFILVPVSTPDLEVVAKLDNTYRGEGGFGST